MSSRARSESIFEVQPGCEPAGPQTDRLPQHLFDGLAENRELRALEALLFASAGPQDETSLSARLSPEANVPELMRRLEEIYRDRGVNVVRVAGGWAFRTAPDLADLLADQRVEPRRLSRAALETLAIIAYHQPVTRADIEEIRGVSPGKGTLDLLLETGWVRMRGRRRTPGRPITFGTTPAFLDHFGLDTLADLPGVDEMRAVGLLDNVLPAGFTVPSPSADHSPRDTEMPLVVGEPDESP